MKIIKSTGHAVLFTLMIILFSIPNVLHAGSCNNCTVTVQNNLNLFVDVTLEYSPSGSYSIEKSLGAVSPGQTVTIQVPADKCPLRLSGRVWSGYKSYAIYDRCLGDNREGNPFCSCSVEECKSSRWNIQGGGGAFHFIRQP